LETTSGGFLVMVWFYGVILDFDDKKKMVRIWLDGMLGVFFLSMVAGMVALLFIYCGCGCGGY
jgi:hypothetical protein